MTAPAFAEPIRTRAEGESFIRDLSAAGLLFHFEDSPETVGNLGPGGEWIPTFEPGECAAVAARVADLYALDWGPYSCPCGFALRVMGAELE